MSKKKTNTTTDDLVKSYIQECRGDLIALRKLQSVVLDYLALMTKICEDPENDEIRWSDKFEEASSEKLEWKVVLTKRCSNSPSSPTLSFYDKNHNKGGYKDTGNKLFHDLMEQKIREFLVEAHHAALELLKEENK